MSTTPTMISKRLIGLIGNFTMSIGSPAVPLRSLL
jgi:hypothetical protein